jgi:hypothetical protein
MSKEPKDTKQQPKSSAASPSSSEVKSEQHQTESSETVRERVMKKISGDPRFIIAKPSGRGFVIVGARPSSGKPAAFDALLTALRQGEPGRTD